MCSAVTQIRRSKLVESGTVDASPQCCSHSHSSRSRRDGQLTNGYPWALPDPTSPLPQSREHTAAPTACHAPQPRGCMRARAGLFSSWRCCVGRARRCQCANDVGQAATIFNAHNRPTRSWRRSQRARCSADPRRRPSQRRPRLSKSDEPTREGLGPRIDGVSPARSGVP